MDYICMCHCFSPSDKPFLSQYGKIHSLHNRIIIIDITKHMVLTKEYNIPNIITWWNSPHSLDISK